MRITFISPMVGLSGGTRVIAIYAQSLMRKGHIVRIISQPPAPISRRVKLKSWLKGRRGLRDWKRVGSHLDGSDVDHHLLDRHRPVVDDDVPDGDVVIATWWETAEWINALSARKGAKVYFIQHHEVFPYLPVARCEATYRMPLHKIVVARWLQELMKERYGDDDVDLVPNSVDRSQFFANTRGKQSKPTVGFLYAEAEFKGVDVALSGLKTARQFFPNLRIVSFGSQKPIQKLFLPTDAEFHFAPPQDQIRKIYASCDVWLTASRSEGFNLPAMEAMACRTPVVSTRTGWPEEAVKTGYNGVLVDIDDVKGLAAGLAWVLERSDSEWRILSNNAYATASVGSWEESATLFEQALKRAAGRGRRLGSLGRSF